MANKSGTSDIPTLLAYPSILTLDECPGIKGIFSYIIEHYGSDGLALMVIRDKSKDEVRVQLGDWKGNIVDLDDKKHALAEICRSFLDEYGKKMVYMLRLADIERAIFYITINTDRKFKLADVRISYNKFIGPGMLRDVFGKMIEVPKTLEICNLNDDVLDAIKDGSGSLGGSLILKPSRFRTVDWNGAINPMYVEIVR